MKNVNVNVYITVL